MQLINKHVDAEELRVEDTNDLLRVLSEDAVIDSDAEPVLDRVDTVTTTRCQHCSARNQETMTSCHDGLKPIG